MLFPFDGREDGMRNTVLLAAAILVLSAAAAAADTVELGPRPYFLIERMADGATGPGRLR